MCSMYWNLRATYTCPVCGHVNKDAELQTHWMGEPGSCMNEYRVGQPVAELAGIQAAVLDGLNDDFGDMCEECNTEIDLGARVENAAVVAVYPIRWTVESGRYEGAKWPDGTWVPPTYAYTPGLVSYGVAR